MSEKKIVIKINYGEKGPGDAVPQVNEGAQIYEWNYKRIFTALILLLVLTGLIIYLTADRGRDTEIAQSSMNTVENKVSSESKKSVSLGTDSVVREPQDTGIDNAIAEKIPDIGSDIQSENVQKALSEPKLNKDKRRVRRSRFTSNVKKREPVDKLTPPFFVQTNKNIDVYFFTELRGFNGTTVTHIWKHKGQGLIKKSFEVRGNRWRVYTSYKLNTNVLGQWEILVVDSTGKVFVREEFEVKAGGKK